MTTAAANSTAAPAKATVEDAATSRPPMAGPITEASCHDREFMAIARGSSGRGTRVGPSAVEAGEKKARATPNTTASR